MLRNGKDKIKNILLSKNVLNKNTMRLAGGFTYGYAFSYAFIHNNLIALSILLLSSLVYLMLVESYF